MLIPEADRVNILLVEDDVELAELTKERLEREGFQVRTEVDGRVAAERIVAEQPGLVILDIMLPSMDGFEVCRTVRTSYRGPILMLTARDEDLDEILGLEFGADDYLTKPVRPRVLIARIRALLRRTAPREPSTRRRIVLGELAVDAGRREVSLSGTNVDLTTIEFDLFWYLVIHAGEVVSRQDIYQALFNYDYDGLDRSVDVYISRVRQKLGEDPANPQFIKTVRGVGYLLASETP